MIIVQLRKIKLVTLETSFDSDMCASKKKKKKEKKEKKKKCLYAGRFEYVTWYGID
jgi:hypothetical protein